MRYSLIEGYNIQNGVSETVSVWCQGCPFRCKGCQNQHTWNFRGGKAWTKNEIEEVLRLLVTPFQKDLAILGGEPLCEENIDDVTNLCKIVRKKMPNIHIFVWTGNHLKDIENKEIWKYVDVIVCEPFVLEKRILHNWYGSSNQFLACTNKNIINFAGEGILVSREGKVIN